jgi:hypothetical protein
MTMQQVELQVAGKHRIEHRVDPAAVAQIRLALHALAHEPRALGVRNRPLVERVDLELEPVVAELVEQMTLQQPRSIVCDAAAAKCRMDGQALELRDLGAAVLYLEPHRPGALAVGFDHEAAELLRLRLRALDLAEQAVAVESRTTTKERLDVLEVHELVQELDVVGSRAANRDHGVSHAIVRRRGRSVPVPSATPARIRTSPPTEDAVMCSSRKMAP